MPSASALAPPCGYPQDDCITTPRGGSGRQPLAPPAAKASRPHGAGGVHWPARKAIIC
jgi:hypothetical protein